MAAEEADFSSENSNKSCKQTKQGARLKKDDRGMPGLHVINLTQQES